MDNTNHNPDQTDEEGNETRPFMAAVARALDDRSHEAEAATEAALARATTAPERERLEHRLRVLRLGRQLHRL